jgi:transposase
MAIAAQIGCTHQYVSLLLKRAGISPRADRSRLFRADDERFRVVWEAAPDLETAAKRLRLTPDQALEKTWRLRQSGLVLKRFPRRDARLAVTRKIEALRKQGLTARQIVRMKFSSHTTVYRVFRPFRPPGNRARLHWSAEEEAMLATLSNKEVAARTGRSVDSVAEHRTIMRARARRKAAENAERRR